MTACVGLWLGRGRLAPQLQARRCVSAAAAACACRGAYCSQCRLRAARGSAARLAIGGHVAKPSCSGTPPPSRRPGCGHARSSLDQSLGAHGCSIGGVEVAPTDEVRTPHLDALVAEGLELDRHYNYKCCSPTRCAIQARHSPSRPAPPCLAPVGSRSAHPVARRPSRTMTAAGAAGGGGGQAEVTSAAGTRAAIASAR